jgi:hypothetical protein
MAIKRIITSQMQENEWTVVCLEVTVHFSDCFMAEILYAETF